MDKEFLYIYNTKFELVGIIDTYKSLIWTERYFTYGDFELQILLPSKKINLLKTNYYVLRQDKEEAMIIEEIQIRTSASGQDYIMAKGRSLLSIMDRRIIWKLLTDDSISPANAIVKIVKMNFLPTSDPTYNFEARFCPELRTRVDYNDTNSIKLSTSWGDNVLDKISEIAKQWEIGIKVIIDPKAAKPLTFVVYAGVGTDCIFSEHLGNLLDTEYKKTIEKHKNSCIVAGSGETEGINRWSQDSYRGTTEPKGLKRKECYLDCSSVNANDITGNYREYLAARGRRELAKHKLKESMSGSASPQSQYIYGKDYKLGDKVTIMNDYGLEVLSRVVEVIESWSDTEHTVIPTFMNNEEE